MRNFGIIGKLCITALTLSFCDISHSSEVRKTLTPHELKTQVEHLSITLGDIRKWEHENGFGQVVLERAGESFFILKFRVRRVAAVGKKPELSSFTVKKPIEYIFPDGEIEEESVVSFIPQFRLDLVFDISNSYKSFLVGEDCIVSEHHFVFLLRGSDGIAHLKSLIEDYSGRFEGNWHESSPRARGEASLKYGHQDNTKD